MYGRVQYTGKINRFPFLDILGYLKNTHKNPKFGRVRHASTNKGTWLGIPWLGLVSLVSDQNSIVTTKSQHMVALGLWRTVIQAANFFNIGTVIK